MSIEEMIEEMAERMAERIATENPADAIRGWLAGSEAYGLTWEANLYRRALELRESWPTASERIRAARERGRS